jgi:hypothetical protein
MTYVILQAISTTGGIVTALVDEQDLTLNAIEDYFPGDYEDVKEVGKVEIEGDLDKLDSYYLSA